MDAITAIRRMMRASGQTYRDVADSLGKSPTYLSGIISRGSVPKLDTAAAIADACGYDLVLVQRDGGDRVRINERDG